MKNADVTPYTREQILHNLKFFIGRMSDEQLRLLAAFASGIFRNYKPN